MSHLIRVLEERSLNAWPGVRQMMLDGWLVRLSGGFTRRANSVSPLYRGSVEPEEKIDRCEAIYRGHGLRCVFKVTPDSQPEDLDQRLQARGYDVEAPTAVLAMPLSGWTGQLEADLIIDDELTAGWLDAAVQLGEVAERDVAWYRRIIEGISAPRRFFCLMATGGPVARGFAVVEEGYAGLFDIATRADARGRGFGRRLLNGMLTASRDAGAEHAYLQVMLTNEPAIGLYRSLGFSQIYDYWYRVKETVPPDG